MQQPQLYLKLLPSWGDQLNYLAGFFHCGFQHAPMALGTINLTMDVKAMPPLHLQICPGIPRVPTHFLPPSWR